MNANLRGNLSRRIKEASETLERLKREGLRAGERLSQELREAVEEQLAEMRAKNMESITTRPSHKGGPWNRRKPHRQLMDKAIYELRSSHYWTYTDLGQLFGISDETAKRIAENYR